MDTLEINDFSQIHQRTEVINQNPTQKSEIQESSEIHRSGQFTIY